MQIDADGRDIKNDKKSKSKSKGIHQVKGELNRTELNIK